VGPKIWPRLSRTPVKKELGITCTVGMGSNVLIAKLASDLAKPDGLRWIDEDTVASVFETLPVKKLWGIGSHTEEKTQAHGHHHMWHLRKDISFSFSPKSLAFSENVLRTWAMARLERPIEVTSADPKSIGHSVTLPNDIWEREEIMSCLLRLGREGVEKGKTVWP